MSCVESCARVSNFETHMLTNSRKAVQLHTVQLLLQTGWKPQNAHTDTYTRKKSFTFIVCENSFTRASNLQTQMLIHTGETPFNCTQCDYSCSISGNLKTHMLIHSGERPFVCDMYNFSCTQVNYL